MGKLLSSEEKYNGPRFNVIQKVFERDDGKKIIRDIVNPGEAAVILPLTENNEVIFVTQLRESIGKISMELPAGMVDSGEKPIETAKRELEEETGFIAKNIEHMISIYPSTGYTSEKVHIFLAKDFEKGKVHLDSTEEILNIVKIPIEECIDKAKNGELENASQIIAILLYSTKYMK
ncbi:MAG: NUDIX hydrolase [Clostridia bacterium]|nr:NUDIX hydrolase [Clostridia bacterium]